MTLSAVQLDTIGAADELHISPLHTDGSRRASVIIWVVRVGDELFVRSARGTAGGWWRHATESGRAHISADGAETDVVVEQVGDAQRAQIDAAYREKYGHYGEQYVGPVTNDDTASSTLRLSAA